MKRYYLALVVLMSSGQASADVPTISEYQRVEAIWYSYGLGCAVQDKSTERAMAWVQGAMGIETALAESSHQLALDWAAVFNGAEISARAAGGYRCEDVTDFPSPVPKSLLKASP